MGEEQAVKYEARMKKLMTSDSVWEIIHKYAHKKIQANAQLFDTISASTKIIGCIVIWFFSSSSNDSANNFFSYYNVHTTHN